MFGIKRRRTLIRVLSYTVSAFCLAVIAGISGYVMAYKYRMSIEYGYQRALTELSEHVDNIDIALQKAQYASTSAQLSGLSAEIWANAGAAQTDIAQMPLSTVNLSNTNKFLSQSGDYANSLTKQLNTDQAITDEQRNTIASLHGYADKLSTQLSDLNSDLQTGRITLFKAENVTKRNNPNQATPTSLQGGFLNIENTFANLPSLIYDGPFSDNVLKKDPVFTQGKAAVNRDEARSIAARFLSQNASALHEAGETGGNLPTWNFNVGNTSIFISKAGGYTVRMLANRAPAQAKLDTNAALQKAQAFLQARGITSVAETYYLTNNNICTINFAYQQNGVVVYPDLIKVGVALDDGGIVSFDSTGYLMNHHTRNLPAVKFTRAQIQAKLNPALTVQKVALAIIPTGGANEAYCYEFRTISRDNQQVIDYFNTQTGSEQQVLILKPTPGGMLAM
ncbi:germination protein YpeB [Ethanoligenens harbinense]|uniref:Germination protein YpeB n=1 Tax=Ethanoligenens harbinense (strain DSM 18485 / JCM 12961 / CGMCC 1.5033 / YUAN-3) TaxID=663278 RepID=E6U685_ETHHY|nr:germination protein YpeB [Ethanoligenens harbinense]ADU26852.1 germination protein YpeB [Ethanoligenens harbinense YUAN-3]AVQ95956.1 germination protein YpeB [Ethanoligenens harbinense YUAN-3]AYF38618.1 germination protein YpeB [Ethanoligenens harbinense]AYF41364.1 germination protein YpeB [Ethanoligenens harbinense]QCN92197.1 germination protein YpeB [Ethanoligenens harbinense]